MIHRGRDDWLFLTEGTNEVTSQYEDSASNTATTQEWVDLLSERARRCEAAGMDYVHIVVPEKITIYDHRLGDLHIDIGLSPANRLRRQLADRPVPRRSYVDLVDRLRERRDEEDLYYRTDSHYTFAGREVVYRALCERLGVERIRDFRQRPSRCLSMTGDLGAKLDPPRSETITLYTIEGDARRTHASPIVVKRERDRTAHSLHSGAHVVYGNDSPSTDPRSIVLFGDSNSHFEPTMMTMMLAETFAAVHFIWSTSLDWTYIRQAKPDIVISQIAERFMRRVPDDLFDLRSYAIDRFGRELHEAGLLTEADDGDIERFDPAYYLSMNPDVASRSRSYPDREAFALLHYRLFGMAEGRHPNVGACLRAIRRA